MNAKLPIDWSDMPQILMHDFLIDYFDADMVEAHANLFDDSHEIRVWKGKKHVDITITRYMIEGLEYDVIRHLFEAKRNELHAAPKI